MINHLMSLMSDMLYTYCVNHVYVVNIILDNTIVIYIQSTPDKSDSQGTGKSVRLSEMSDLPDIQNIMQIRHEMRSAS